jgi:hydroxymethylbilane synthase
MTERTFVVGTRGSRLALAQTQLVVDALRAAHPDVRLELREIKTEGDRSAAPLSQIGGLGVFTKALEDALLAGEIDIAVHSLKDLPPRLPDGLTLAAIPKRGDPRDALVTRDGRTLADLPAGARIGTGSARRAVQLRVLRPDVEPVEIRGNVDTRIRKVDDGEYDGAVLAMAGLERLGLAARASQIFTVNDMVPAVGQGAMGVETRTDDGKARDLMAEVEDRATGREVWAERAFLDWLGAGCRLPVAAHAVFTDERLNIEGMIADDAGAITRRSGSARMERDRSVIERLTPWWRRKPDADPLPSAAAIQLGIALAQELWNSSLRSDTRPQTTIISSGAS